MRIARTNISDVRLIPESLKITEEEWVKYATESHFLIARNVEYTDESFQPKFFLKPDIETIGVEFIWRAARIVIDFDKVMPELIIYANKIAEDLNAVFYICDSLPYPKSKILAAQKRLAKKSNEPQIEYQKESFGGNNMWLAIRSNLNQVKDYFNLKGEVKEWDEALEEMHACEGLFMFEFRGWTFVAGQNVDILFGCESKGEDAIEKCHVDKLIEWGEVFKDVQLFTHYERSTYFNAFYRVLNGVLVYGEYETESYQKKYGKVPKNVKDLPDNNANSVASEWNYDPDYLRYQLELKNAQAWVVNII